MHYFYSSVYTKLARASLKRLLIASAYSRSSSTSKVVFNDRRVGRLLVARFVGLVGIGTSDTSKVVVESPFELGIV